MCQPGADDFRESDMTAKKFFNGLLAVLFILLLVATLIPTTAGP